MSNICHTCGENNTDDAIYCRSCNSSFNLSTLKETTIGSGKKNDFSEGDFIAGTRYEVLDILGQGGMGVVYLVKDTMLADRKCALKMVHPELVANPEARKRFEDEVATCLDLHHPSIIRVYNLERSDSNLFFTMEYLEGRSLGELIAARQGDQLPAFSLEEIKSILLPLLDGLKYAHQHTIHRDIKPENIMVLGEFPDNKVKILDFGIARTMSTSRFTQTSQGLGTPYYMAPEQLEDAHDIDLRADIYSVGMILYEMLTGEKAVGRFELPSELLSESYAPFDSIIIKALAPKPDRRHQFIGEFQEDLKQILSESMERPDQKVKDEVEPEVANIVLQTEGGLQTKNIGNAVRLDEKKQEKDEQNKNPPSLYTDHITGMEFVYIPGGSFEMGSPESEIERNSTEGPQHEVYLDGFYMGKYEVTQGEYETITGNNPSEFKSGSNYPVENVSWGDSKSFIKKLNSKSGKGYRLPTEAEWEYAARAGTTTPFSFGNTISTSQANYDGNSVYGSGSKDVYRKKTTPVGEFQPNSFGLYDMHGNVWEWCQDWYEIDYYKMSLRSNPSGPPTGSLRVVRGGSWCANPWSVRSASRYGNLPGYRCFDLGFRLVLPVLMAH